MIQPEGEYDMVNLKNVQRNLDQALDIKAGELIRTVYHKMYEKGKLTRVIVYIDNIDDDVIVRAVKHFEADGLSAITYGLHERHFIFFRKVHRYIEVSPTKF